MSPASDNKPPGEQTESEPDYRFTLANERTFLAWIRTALGLIAGGVAVHQLASSFAPGARTTLAVLCLVLAAVLAAASYPRWRGIQSAMRRGDGLPSTVLIAVLAVGMLAITVFSVVLVLQP